MVTRIFNFFFALAARYSCLYKAVSVLVMVIKERDESEYLSRTVGVLQLMFRKART